METEGIATFVARRNERRPWLRHAECRDHPDPDAFFPRSNSGRPARDRKRPEPCDWCDRCPVGAACEAFAKEDPLVEGIWNGRLYRRGKDVSWWT